MSNTCNQDTERAGFFCPVCHVCHTPPFDPTTNAADAFAVISDTAPMEFWRDFAEATGRLVAQVILVRDYLRTRGYSDIRLIVLRDTTLKLRGTAR